MLLFCWNGKNGKLENLVQSVKWSEQMPWSTTTMSCQCVCVFSYIFIYLLVCCLRPRALSLHIPIMIVQNSIHLSHILSFLIWLEHYIDNCGWIERKTERGREREIIFLKYTNNNQSHYIYTLMPFRLIGCEWWKTEHFKRFLIVVVFLSSWKHLLQEQHR